MAKRVLVVDDEEDVVELVAFHLRKEGWAVSTAASIATGRAELRGARPDVVVLDVMLPDGSGTDLCREVRRDPELADVPVLVLSARHDEIDRVVAFEVGADDYVTKPFSPRELVLRVKALMRRGTPTSDPPLASHVVIGDLQIDVPRHEVLVGGARVELTALEFKLLLELVSSRGHVKTRPALLRSVWGYDGETETRTVDTHVKRLRAKLGAAGDYITTLRGVGYRLQDPRAGGELG